MLLQLHGKAAAAEPVHENLAHDTYRDFLRGARAYIEADGGTDIAQAFFVNAHTHEVFVYQDGLALASHETDISRRGSGGRGQGYVVEPVAARGDDDEGVGVDGEFVQRLFGLLGDYHVGVGEAFRVGEFFPVVGDE